MEKARQKILQVPNLGKFNVQIKRRIFCDWLIAEVEMVVQVGHAQITENYWMTKKLRKACCFCLVGITMHYDNYIHGAYHRTPGESNFAGGNQVR